MIPDLGRVIELLEAQRAEGLHLGAQCSVSLRGEVLLDVAIGESVPGRSLELDDIMLWYSAGKPLTAVAILQLWEQGKLGLDDPVAKYVDGWGGGKERVTLRHILVHTAGFPMMGRAATFDRDLSYEDAVARIATHPVEWEPGTAAMYHPASSWKILGWIVQQVDGRPIDVYLREEILTPLGLSSSSLGIPADEQARLGNRIVPVHWTGHALPVHDDQGLRMVPYRIDEIHNETWHVAKVEPGGGMRGPAFELRLFYESLLGYGPAVLAARAVEVLGAVHRHGIKDRLLGTKVPWGLGVQVSFSGGTGRRTFGHGGMASSRGVADPEHDLVIVVVANGLASFLDAEQRVYDVTDAVYSALGDDVARTRQPAVPVMQGWGLPT